MQDANFRVGGSQWPLPLHSILTQLCNLFRTLICSPVHINNFLMWWVGGWRVGAKGILICVGVLLNMATPALSQFKPCAQISPFLVFVNFLNGLGQNINFAAHKPHKKKFISWQPLLFRQIFYPNMCDKVVRTLSAFHYMNWLIPMVSSRGLWFFRTTRR